MSEAPKVSLVGPSGAANNHSLIHATAVLNVHDNNYQLKTTQSHSLMSCCFVNCSFLVMINRGGNQKQIMMNTDG